LIVLVPDRSAHWRSGIDGLSTSQLGPFFLLERLRPSRRWLGMDKQTKHEIMLLALGTVLVEAPLLAIVAALAILGQ